MSPASSVDGIEAFVAKAAARLPVLDVAALFVAPDRRPGLLALAALHGELREAVFDLSDRRLTAVKCGWWADELVGLGRGATRHPVTRVLVGLAADWGALATELRRTVADPDPVADLDAAIAALLPLATAWARIDTALAAGRADSVECARFWVVHWLRQRLQHGGPVAEPQWRAAAAAVLGAQPAQVPGLPYLTRLVADADRRWLAARSTGRSPRDGTGWSAPWRAWRCARDAAPYLTYAAPAIT